MSTEQISGKGATIANPDPQIESSVNSSTAQSNSPHISSFVSRANGQIEAAISHLVRDWQGTEIPDQELRAFGNSIKAIVSKTFTGEVEIKPDTSLPLFVQVPDHIAWRLTDPERVGNLLDAAKAMRDAALNDPQFKADSELDFEEACAAFQSMINDAARALKGRGLGFDPTVATAPMVEPTIQPKPLSDVITNSLIDAAVGNFIKEYEGLEIQPKHVVQLAAQIKRLYADVAEGTKPKTTDPVYVLVPEWIVNTLQATENGDFIAVAVEAMYHEVCDNPSFQNDPDVDYEGVYKSWKKVIQSAINALRGRGLHIGPLDGDYDHKSPRPLTPTPTVEPAPQKAPEVASEKKPKATLYDISSTTYLNQKIIQSDSSFFDILTDQDDLAQLIENISGWYCAWVQHIEESAGDIESSHFVFPHIMSFLGRMMGAVAEVDAKEQIEEVELKGLKKEVELRQELSERGTAHLKALDDNIHLMKASIKAFEDRDAEIKRLRDLYEPSVTDSAITSDEPQQ